MDEDILKFFGVMMTLMTTGLVGYAGVTVINAFQRRSNRLHSGLNPDEVEALRASLEETEMLRQRLGDLEERVDFAERLLAQQQEAPRLGGGTT